MARFPSDPVRAVRALFHRSLRVFLAALPILAACTDDAPEAASGELMVLEGARILVGDGSPPIEDAVLVVEAGRIRAVGPRDVVDVPSGAARLDLSGTTVMPALVNTHMHLSNDRDGLEEQLLHLAYYGVGVAVSLGSDGEEVIFQVRERPIPGAARVLSAGRGITRPEPGRSEVPYWVNTEAEAREAVRELAERDVDIVKIWVDDRNGQYEKLGPDLYGPIIDEAHRLGLRVTAHIFSLEDAKGLLQAGLDAFAHGIRDQDVDDELVELWRGRPHVVLVPNLPDPGVARDLSWLAGTVPAERLAEMQAQATDRPQAQDAFGIQARNLVRLHAEGLPIAFGTDGSAPWAVHEEMADMVRAGLTPQDVLTAATATSAAFMGMEDAGTLEAGKRADFIILEANPLDDITHTRRISDVYLGGVRVDREGIRQRLVGEPGED